MVLVMVSFAGPVMVRHGGGTAGEDLLSREGGFASVVLVCNSLAI